MVIHSLFLMILRAPGVHAVGRASISTRPITGPAATHVCSERTMRGNAAAPIIYLTTTATTMMTTSCMGTQLTWQLMHSVAGMVGSCVWLAVSALHGGGLFHAFGVRRILISG